MLSPKLVLQNNMNQWLLPTFGALIMWGFWSFIPKLTTQHINPKSAVVFEAVGGLMLAAIILISVRFQVDVNAKGTTLAIITGMLGFLDAFCFLNAVSKGPVTLVASISALYPIVSIVLAILFLNETLTLKQMFGIVLALIAMILVAT